jgi:hypothetical protein
VVLIDDNQKVVDQTTARAEAKVASALEKELDLVPCPVCGWYQRNMIPEARRQRWRWMLHLGVCLTLWAIPIPILGSLFNKDDFGEAVVPWPILIAATVLLGSSGIGLIAAKVVSSRRYDPNSEDVEARKKLAQSRAILRREMEGGCQAGQPGA